MDISTVDKLPNGNYIIVFCSFETAMPIQEIRIEVTENVLKQISDYYNYHKK